jgi:hypothetical protein
MDKMEVAADHLTNTTGQKVYAVKTAGVPSDRIAGDGYEILILKDGVVQGAMNLHIPITLLSAGQSYYYGEN